MTPAELNHLRRLIGWVRCEIGQSPDEMIATMNEVARLLGNLPLEEAERARLVEAHANSVNVPKYVRSAVKALEKIVSEADKPQSSGMAMVEVPQGFTAYQGKLYGPSIEVSNKGPQF